MNNNVWVARCEAVDGATYAYVFNADADESPDELGAAIATDFEYRLIEVIPIADFLLGNIYELCTV